MLLIRGKKQKKNKHLWRVKGARDGLAASVRCQLGLMKNVYGTTLTGNYLFLLEARSFIRRRKKRARRQRRKLVPAFQQRGKKKKTLRRIKRINLSDGQFKSLFGFLRAARDTGCTRA